MMSNMHNTEAPPADAGWEPITGSGPFTIHVGKIFQTRIALEPNEPMRYGFRVQAHQCNPREVCHGGMLATFLDIALARGSRAALNIQGATPTVSMTLDYLSPARLGDWIESRVQLVHRARKTAFMQAVLWGPEAPVLRGSGIFRLPNDDAPPG
jgi:uncharacterized protein (TIGR00369 family)